MIASWRRENQLNEADIDLISIHSLRKEIIMAKAADIKRVEN